jgi:hypothetical protein
MKKREYPLAKVYGLLEPGPVLFGQDANGARERFTLGNLTIELL